jgi:acetylornithine deacetylase/succinyl-diaminopimelate desuccinylase-like protein
MERALTDRSQHRNLRPKKSFTDIIFFSGQILIQPSADATVIPGTVRAQVSIRIVPDQSLDVIVQSLRYHLEGAFKDLNSPNTIKITVEHTADWWLGDLDGVWYSSLEKAVSQEWGVEPLRIREGGVSDTSMLFGVCSLLIDISSV